MARIVRVDEPDSLMTLFKIEIRPNEHQEIRVPTFLADLLETQIASKDFNAEKAKAGNSTVLE